MSDKCNLLVYCLKVKIFHSISVTMQDVLLLDTTGQDKTKAALKKKISVKCGQVDTETSAFLYKHTSTECETLGIRE